MSLAIDPELVPWVPALPTFDFADPVATRAMVKEMTRSIARDLPDTILIRNYTVPGDTDRPAVNMRVYSPTAQVSSLPALVYFHGGGYVTGEPADYDSALTELTAAVDAVVVSVDYRLAPENPFPAGLHDCYAALLWTVDNAEELRIDPDWLAIGGESAGGGLAAAVALLNRDRGGPSLRLQWLGIPAVDHRGETESMTTLTDTPMLARAAAVNAWKHYTAGGTLVDGEDWTRYAAPATATDLSALPAAYIEVGQYDPLRDEGIEYARRLAQADVSTELRLYPGVFHGATAVRGVKVVERIIAEQHAALRRALHPEG
ncbi:alpha/beta hydrolase [Nocardia sp. NPDC058518]|uniref:alpha/beta hydrolase n=1 Tax=Nocardia sp. NPDC058518 TaxID=3346534 RepID=UPI003654D049